MATPEHLRLQEITDDIYSWRRWGLAICNDGTLTDTNSTYTNNTGNDGGAIYNEDTLTDTNSSFSNNSATDNGGAIFNIVTLTDTENIFNNNTSNNDGGAIYNDYNAVLNVSNNTFTNNNASNEGGVIFSNGNTITNSVVEFNRIVGNSNSTIYSMDDSVDANLNWWESNSNPSSNVNSNVNITSWLILTVKANPNIIPYNNNSAINVDLLHTNNGTIESSSIPDGVPVTFKTNLGNISGSSSIVNGSAESTLNSGVKAGVATVSVTVDNQLVTLNVNVDNTILPSASANVKGGLYNTNQIVTLTMSKAGKIYYTIDGTTPTAQSILYTKPITITATTTLKYLAIDSTNYKSPIYTQNYVIEKTALIIVKTNPKYHAINVPLTTPITITFNKNILSGINYNNIYVKNLNTGKLVQITKSISKNILTIKMTKSRLNNDKYIIYIPKYAFKDQNGNLIAEYTIPFKTG